jgi:hypothetical protein
VSGDSTGGRNTGGLWRPLRIPTFRKLLVADIVSDVGTFMQSVGSAWLMVSLGAGPLYVALTQTDSSAPFFLLALPAGSVGDIVDRRLNVFSFVGVGGQFKTDNLWTVTTDNFQAAETGEFYFGASSVRKSVCTLVRQLRGPHLTTCA